MKKNVIASVFTTVGAVTMVLSGATPALASPTPEVVRTSSTASAMPVLGIGAGSYAWWCSGFPSTCKYVTLRDNWGGVYKAKCLDYYCTKLRIVG